MTDRELLQRVFDELQDLDDSKSKHGMSWQVPIIERLRTRLAQPEPDDEGLYTETQVQRMVELLMRCENEMRYAGWTKYESDNSARNGVYEQVKQFLEKNNA